MHPDSGVVTVGNNESSPLRPDSLPGEFTKASESRISENTQVVDFKQPILSAPYLGGP